MWSDYIDLKDQKHKDTRESTAEQEHLTTIQQPKSGTEKHIEVHIFRWKCSCSHLFILLELFTRGMKCFHFMVLFSARSLLRCGVGIHHFSNVKKRKRKTENKWKRSKYFRQGFWKINEIPLKKYYRSGPNYVGIQWL